VVAFGEQVLRADAVRYDVDAHTEMGPVSLSRAAWRKSSYSACNGNCVEVAGLSPDRIAVRDTKDAGQGPVLVFAGAAWSSFLERVKNGI
jgi:hypothetical protein